MRFSVAAIVGFAGAAMAQTAGFDAITNPAKSDTKVSAGSMFDITWLYTANYPGTVTILLLGGSSPSTLQVLSTIASAVDNSKGFYSWAVDSSLGDKTTYGIKIAYDSNPAVFQYSFDFKILGSAGASVTNSLGSASSLTPVLISTTAPSIFQTPAVSNSLGSASSFTPVIISTTAPSIFQTPAVTNSSGSASSFTRVMISTTEPSIFQTPAVTNSSAFAANWSSTADLQASQSTSLTSAKSLTTNSAAFLPPASQTNRFNVPVNSASSLSVVPAVFFGGLFMAVFAL